MLECQRAPVQAQARRPVAHTITLQHRPPFYPLHRLARSVVTTKVKNEIEMSCGSRCY